VSQEAGVVANQGAVEGVGVTVMAPEPAVAGTVGEAGVMARTGLV
jgi:hypothetical protein